MKIDNTTTINYQYLKAIEYLEMHDTVRISLFGIDVTNFKNINNSALKQQVIGIVEILKNMKKYEISRSRKGH